MTTNAVPALATVFSALAALAPATSRADGVDYPLKVGTAWTYHLHQEIGPGVQFAPDVAPLAHGNRVEMTVICRVVAHERIRGDEYARVESTRNGHPYFVEWYRTDADGLYLGRTIDLDSGETTELNPPERFLNATLRRGESWNWRSSSTPVSSTTQVHSPERMKTPAGSFDTTMVVTDMRLGEPPQQVRVQARRWFVPGTGFAKLDTDSSVAGRRLVHVVLTLERFEPAR